MAFKPKISRDENYDSPNALFRDLRNRKVEGLIEIQSKVLERYQAEAFDKSDVAIELPTGSGKTLVGLLIGEYRRRVNGERVLYLAPTKQLVGQVVEQAREKYGIKPIAFPGSQRDFSAKDKAAYKGAQAIAVAPFSSLFNVNPFFKDAQVILLDDAHAAENYIASAWSMNIFWSEHEVLDQALLDLFKDAIPTHHLYNLRQKSTESADRQWVEKITTPRLLQDRDALSDLLDEHTLNTDLSYRWQWLRGHLDGCHLYMNHAGWLLRPLIPPSMNHAPFANATQRIFMSATLGQGGDLERITGVRSLHRLPIPKGWDKQGIGRRFFIFPEQSLETEAVDQFLIQLAKSTDRSLILTPSNREAKKVKETLKDSSLTFFGMEDLEASKQAFVTSTNAAAVLANRYDGIDLPGDECRLLVIQGLPKIGNLQERFIQSRLPASIVLADRIRTRIIQAIGRCTRGATDYAAVCVLGQDFADWMAVRDKRNLFHPELQGELLFGLEQSQDTTADEMIANLDIFLEHGDEWDGVDAQIREHRDESTQFDLPGADQMMASSKHEVDYQYAIWDGDYERALGLAQAITEKLAGDDCKGYRGFWQYLAGCAAWMQSERDEDSSAAHKAREHFGRAAACLPSLRWLRPLAKTDDEAVTESPEEIARAGRDQIMAQQMDEFFQRKGYVQLRKLERDVTTVYDGLASDSSDQFEQAQELLGQMLGFEAGNSTDSSSPDPWWKVDDLVVVFESKSRHSTANRDVSVSDVRQARTHAEWLYRQGFCQESDTVVTTLATLSPGVDQEGHQHAADLAYWNIEDLRAWASEAMSMLRDLRQTYAGEGNLVWRAKVIDAAKQHKKTLDDVVNILRKQPLSGVEPS